MPEADSPGTVEIPAGLQELLGYSASACGCGREHAVDLRRVSIREGALEDIVEYAGEIGRGLDVAVICDRVTRQVAAERVVDLLKRAGHEPRAFLVADGADGRPHADEQSLGSVERAVTGVDLAVSVGSGTLTDLGKLAAYRSKVPFYAVATAASMNGYASAIAAVTVRGLKRTISCAQPLAIVADLSILRRAPAELGASGFGDLSSKPTSLADFRLAGRLRGDYYCPVAERVVYEAERRAADSAEGVRGGDPAAMAALIEALILSGISMKLVGSSGPASGGEHLISHLLDMTAAERGRRQNWHGAQVGVCTLVTAALYERLREMDPEAIEIEGIVSRRPERAALERRIRQQHGARAEEVIEQCLQKELGPDELRAELGDLRSNWSRIWEGLGDTLRPAALIRDRLQAAGAPVTVGELGLTPEQMSNAYLRAREIRNRFSVLDLAYDLGVLESFRDEVLGRSGCLG